MLRSRSFACAVVSFLVACEPVPPPSDAGRDAPGLTDTPALADAPLADAPDAADSCGGPPGLYREGSCTELADGVRRFVPRYALWSDGADKERFVYLPPGARIDTTDADGWIYPVGTIFWKTFSRDGLRIETRMNEKVAEGVGPSAWRQRTFAWSLDQRSVGEVTAGVVDALGTGHDIPPTSLCVRCHDGAPTDVSLGFTAIQLNHEGSPVSLATLLSEDRLTVAIAEDAARVPGDAITSEALGYLHANCGACHGGPAAPRGLRFWVGVGLDEPTATDTFLTAVGQRSGWPGAAERVLAGDPEGSAVVLRMSSRDPLDQMPPVATELVDETGIATVRAWVTSLAP